MSEKTHIIIGGGIIGLSVGWQLLRAGVKVEIIDASSGVEQSTGWVAAGMLAPNAEAGYEEENLFRLCMSSLSLYEQFLAELSGDVTSVSVPKIDRCGSMMVAVTSDDARVLERQYNFRMGLGEIGIRLVTGIEARELEPLLSPKVKQALFLPDDAQINNRSLLLALQEAFVNRGGVIHRSTTIEDIHTNNGVVTVDGLNGHSYSADSITLCAGAGISLLNLEGIPSIRPVKGQVVTLKSTDSLRLSHLIRSPRVYLAQKDDKRIMIGASVEEKGNDSSITAGPIMELLHYAWEVVPATYELEIAELKSGLRPASRDNCPVMGRTDQPNIFIATGHYRNGFLLAPITAYAMSDLIREGSTEYNIQAFAPSRFSKKQSLVFA
ncbi:MAG: glycine oxidase ThiO [bacterium]